MKLLSLFDGSGAFPLAAGRLGITARYASEIEPFPIAVTRKRFPHMEHLGDIAKIDGGAIEPCELVTFGSPCTDISIAGRGGGLSAERSGLFFEAVRIMGEMLAATNNEYPRCFLFENVPNLISIHGGADWKTAMDSFAGLGFICDPNILDSQEFGVAQRRKRIFIVGVNRKHYNPADYANIPNARDKRMQKAVDNWGSETFHGVASRPHEIRRRYLSEILEHDADPKYYLTKAACLGILRRVDAKGKEIPYLLRSALEYQAELHYFGGADGQPMTFEPGVTARLGRKGSPNICSTLRADMGDNQTAVALAVEKHPADSRINLDYSGTVQTLTSRCGTGGNNVPICAEPVVYGISSVSSNSMNSPNPHSGVYETDMAKTLDTSAQAPKNQGGLVVCVQGNIIGRKDENGAAGKGVQTDISYTLDAHDTPAVAYSMTTGSFTQVCEEKSPTLTSRDYKDAPIVNRPAFGIDRAAYNQSPKALYKPQIDVESTRPLTAQGPGAVSAPPGYIVRRLTPRECLVLMNLPCDWCDRLNIDEPTECDYTFWESVFSTLGKKKSRKQISSWLKNPYSDSACYRMAGNGVVVAVAEWILEGIICKP